jgi:hypothetical protein
LKLFFWETWQKGKKTKEEKQKRKRRHEVFNFNDVIMFYALLSLVVSSKREKVFIKSPNDVRSNARALITFPLFNQLESATSNADRLQIQIKGDCAKGL